MTTSTAEFSDPAHGIHKLLSLKEQEGLTLKEIERLETALQGRKDRLETIITSYQELKGTLSSLNKFPVELLAEIFMLSVPSTYERSMGSLEQAPLVLCWNNSELSWSRDIISAAPHLRHLASATGDINELVKMPSLNALSRLELSEMSIPEVLEMLPLFPRLEHCVLELVYADEDDEDLMPVMVTHSKLATFHIPHSGSNATPLLDRITLPSLVDFAFSHFNRPWPQSSFESLMDRSACKLTKLVLESSSVDPDDMLACLELPGIQLSVTDLDLHPDTGAFKDFVYARLKQSILKRVSLTIRIPMLTGVNTSMSDYLKELESMRARGLEVEIDLRCEPLTG
ncbi:hypothetical protein C8J56DRAFT_886787 [Mycena floridula]|nr:hypothetical protein C8J56DRAFT_886787 [Mycena floridula]